MPLETVHVPVIGSGMLLYTLKAHSALYCDAALFTVSVADTQPDTVNT